MLMSEKGEKIQNFIQKNYSYTLLPPVARKLLLNILRTAAKIFKEQWKTKTNKYTSMKKE